MGYLLSFTENTPSKPPHEPTPRKINASPKSALLVENDACLSKFLKRCLKEEGYAVRTAWSSEEGLRLYRDFGPFNVVLVNYYVPQQHGQAIDPLASNTTGIELALAIRGIDSSQGIIITANAFRSAVEVPRPPEVMHIPLLVDSSVLQLRELLEKIEVDRAIKSLTSAELQRLQKFANFRVRGLGRAAVGRDGEDLLEEALCRTLIGAEDAQQGRHWNRKVPFVQHLAGAITSIANMWKRQCREKETYLASELTIHDADGLEHSPLDTVHSTRTPADRHLVEKCDEDKVFAVFRDDAHATHILRGIVAGLKKNEIKLTYGLDERQYVAAMRRLRVKLIGRADRENNNGTQQK